MHTVYMTQIQDADAFDLEVKKFIARLKASNFEKNKPRPSAPHLIEAAIKRVVVKGKPDDYIAEYVIEDDREKVDENK